MTLKRPDNYYKGPRVKGGGGGGGYQAYLFGNINFEIKLMFPNKAHTCTKILVKFRDLGAQPAPSHVLPAPNMGARNSHFDPK